MSEGLKSSVRNTIVSKIPCNYMDRIELGTSNKYLMFCNMVCNYRERRRQAN